MKLQEAEVSVGRVVLGGRLCAIPGLDESSFPAEDLSPGGAHCGQISIPDVSMPSQVSFLRQLSEDPVLI